MNAPLRPTMALVLHTRESAAVGRPSDQDAVLWLHPITAGPDKVPVLDAGRVLTRAEAAVLGDRLRRPDVTEDTALFLPPTLLRATTTGLTWYRPAARARQHWRTPTGRVTLDAVLPSLLFHVQEGVLAVAAFIGDERPTEHTRLFAAPLGNVYSDGIVCIGNCTLPSTWDPSTCKRWEAVLLDSNFSHINAATLRGNASTEELIAFWQKRARYRTPPAERSLAPLNVTAGAWVRRLTENR